jgi:hypothetical protein
MVWVIAYDCHEIAGWKEGVERPKKRHIAPLKR